MRTSKFLAVAFATAFGVIACDRTAKNKIISGSDAIGVAAEAASVQAVEDIWTMTSFGGTLGAAFAAPGAITAPEGMDVPAVQSPYGTHNTNNACTSALSAGGFGTSPGTDGYYTLRISPGGGFSGNFRIGFLSGTSAINFCTSHATIDGLGLKVAGTMGFGNIVNINLTFTNFNASPTLNGTISGSVTGQLFQMTFSNCVYSSQVSKVPTSGTWTGSFGSGTTGVALLKITFSSTGGQGSLIAGHRNYVIRIGTNGVMTIS